MRDKEELYSFLYFRQTTWWKRPSLCEYEQGSKINDRIKDFLIREWQIYRVLNIISSSESSNLPWLQRGGQPHRRTRVREARTNYRRHRAASGPSTQRNSGLRKTEARCDKM